MNINVTAGMIVITDKEVCWCCGAEGRTTKHHAIPQRLNPLKNVLVPVCQLCHDKINAQDVNGLIGFMYKTKKYFRETLDRSIHYFKQSKQ